MNEESMSRKKGDRHVVAMRKCRGVTEAQKEVWKENRNITPVEDPRLEDAMDYCVFSSINAEASQSSS